MRLVIVESPYAGDVKANLLYARKCLADSLGRGEAPLMSHLLYTQVLDDLKPDERALGISAGLAWMTFADKVIVYSDLGITAGMRCGIAKATALGIAIEYRKIL